MKKITVILIVSFFVLCFQPSVSGFTLKSLQQISDSISEIEEGKALYYQGNPSRAIIVLFKAVNNIRNDTQYSEVEKKILLAKTYFWLGICYEKNNHITTAEGMYKFVLDNDPLFDPSLEISESELSGLFNKIKTTYQNQNIDKLALAEKQNALTHQIVTDSSSYSDAIAQNERGVESEKNDFKRIEFGLLFGFGLPNFSFNNSFSDSYSSYWYDRSYQTNYYVELDMNLAFSSSITGKAKSNFAFGGFLNYFFIKNFGLQIMVEGSKFDIPVQSSHSVDLSFLYYWNGVQRSYSANPSIDNTIGNLSIMPISFNLYTRFEIGKSIFGHVSGGLTYYKVALQAETRGGAGVVYLWYDNTHDLDWLAGDSVLIPIYIDESYSGIGGNIGGGLTFQIQKNIGVVAEIRYYLAPTKEVTWKARAGNYQKVLYNEYGWSFATNSLSISNAGIDDFLAENGDDLVVEIDPSYFRISIGLIVKF